jgi:hypothetical protein
VGYIAPAAVLQHFLKDYQQSQQQGRPLGGFPALGLQITGLESTALRRSLQLQQEQGEEGDSLGWGHSEMPCSGQHVRCTDAMAPPSFQCISKVISWSKWV